MSEPIALPIILVLVLAFVQSMLPAYLRWMTGRYPNGKKANLMQAMGPRDEGPEMPLVGQRAQRALNNLTESYLLLVPALALVLFSGAGDQAATWVYAFVAARLVYLVTYLAGTPVVRSLVWFAGHIAVVMMVLATF